MRPAEGPSTAEVVYSQDGKQASARAAVKAPPPTADANVAPRPTPFQDGTDEKLEYADGDRMIFNQSAVEKQFVANARVMLDKYDAQHNAGHYHFSEQDRIRPVNVLEEAPRFPVPSQSARPMNPLHKQAES